jgi:hypothetical protein
MSAEAKAVDHKIISIRKYCSCRGSEIIISNLTTIISCTRFRYADIGIAIPEISSYFEISRTGQNRRFCIAEFDDLCCFQDFQGTPI